MDTSASNRRLRILLTAVHRGTLNPRPDFQRRLVWSTRHKNALIRTVLEGYPFPEVYVAAGDVNPDTGEGVELLVDGQQRITTLYQYFIGSPDLRLTPDVVPYARLGQNAKLAYLDYQVVVRDLGQRSIEDIKEIFVRINSTNYSLNAMEIHNARFDGAFKAFAEDVAQDRFFEEHHVFRAAEIRRMEDTRFALTFVVTAMSTYFNRDSDLEEFLRRYNDEFPQRGDLEREVQSVFGFLDQCQLGDTRAWNRADLFTLLVELHRALVRDGLCLDPQEVGDRLRRFYATVDRVLEGVEASAQAGAYHFATLQASNDRANRILRGRTLRAIILGTDEDEAHPA